jgi:hypothetical protein
MHNRLTKRVSTDVHETGEIRSQMNDSVADLLRRYLPFVLVAATVAMNLVALHAETTPVAYLNDGSIHAEMTRFATAQLRAGHLPLTSWFPFLGEGSPQFLHYQSLGAMLTGALGIAIGSNTAYVWMLYLLLATWPISIYLCVRLLGFDRYAAAFAAMISPFVVSTLGIGYEQQSYLTIGYGLWSQLFAMWTLPLAWGFTWRAMKTRRSLLPAALFISATMAFHFLTGYLAVFGVLIAFVTSATPINQRLRRLSELVLGVVALSAWVVIPLIVFRAYASVNEFLQNGPDVNSYGARRVLSWLFEGELFDANRLPILTVFVLLGLLLTVVHSRSRPESRNLLLLFVVSLLLFFGRTTFGAAFDLLPGHADLFLRRFLMGVQLGGIIAAGLAIATLGRFARQLLRRVGTYLDVSLRNHDGARIFTGAIGLISLVVVLAPCWSQIFSIDRADAQNIHDQQLADTTQGVEIAPLIATIKRVGGRVYAGLPVQSTAVGGWGSSFQVGEVPVFKYLTGFDVDEVGYTLRTASLMTDPEAYFNEYDPSDYPLFAVTWLLYPTTRKPIVAATKVMQRGPYVLWRVHTSSYLQLVDITGSYSANRTDIGRLSANFITSNLPLASRYLSVAYNGAAALAPTLPSTTHISTAPGRVIQSTTNLTLGNVTAKITAKRRSVLVLKVSFDPGWHATLDGHSVATTMIAPAYVGIVVPPGHHEVTFTYESGAHEGPLLGIGLLGLCVLLAVHWRERRRYADNVGVDRD